MASLSIARPGKGSERQYLGDLAGLFDRHRRRSGLALTPDSFAADMAASDSLRSGLFTLCNAISHMGESDLSSEELLGLVARALGGADFADAGSGTQIPASTRDAFIPGYEAWRNRDLQPITAFTEPEVWPPVAPGARKPPASETAQEAFAQNEIAAAASGGPSQPIVPTPGRRTVQEAISLVRRERGGDSGELDPHSAHTGANGEDLGSMTLGELHRFLEEIEGRVSRLGPHIQQLGSPIRDPKRERPAQLPDTVIQFPSRHGSVEGHPHEGPYGADFDLEAFTRRRPIPAPNLRAEDAFLARAGETDERPRGIDALVAAAPAWANASPPARSFDEDSFLARHAYLAPARRPGSTAPASVYYAETPAAPLPPPVTALPAAPEFAPAHSAVLLSVAPPVPPLIGLDVEDDPLLSPIERLQGYMLGLPPRNVFLALASLTILAGGLAGFMAYKTLHTGRVPQFKDLEPTVRFGSAADAPAVDGAASASSAPVPAPQIYAPAIAARPTASSPAISTRGTKHPAPVHRPPVAVWPPVPQLMTRDIAVAAPAPSASQNSHSGNTLQPAGSAPLYVPATTMIGYALSTPQPAYPSAQAHGISGTVAVEISVSRLGDVTSARALSGPAELRAAAVAAVHGWHFRPYLTDGKPTEVATTLQFYFKGE